MQESFLLNVCRQTWLLKNQFIIFFLRALLQKKTTKLFLLLFTQKKKVFSLHVGLCHHIAVVRLIYECKFLRASENIDSDLAAEVN